MIKWIVKKYALSLVNDALKSAKDNKDVEKWRSKIQDAIWVLNQLLNALKDYQISKDECDKIIELFTKLLNGQKIAD